MDKPKIRLLPSGLEIESGFTVEDEHVNKKLGLHIKSKLFAGEELKIQWIKTTASSYNEAIVINHMLNKGIDLLNSDYRMLALLNQSQTQAQ